MMYQLTLTRKARLTTALGMVSLLITQAGCSSLPGFKTADETDTDLAATPKAIPATAYYGDLEQRRVERHFYAGTGLGISRLEPDTSDRPSVTVTDKNAGAGQITLGMDINKHAAVELHSADLGSAGLSSNTRINYHTYGASALLYAGKNRHRYKRRGLTGYGRLGVGVLDNSPVGDVGFTNVNSNHLLFGAGLEYMTHFGLGIRAELISFDADAQYAQLGLMYRTGKKPRQRQPLLTEVKQEPVLIAPVVAVAVAVQDNDNDGVPDDSDSCVTTAPDVAVNEKGCALFAGVIEGVNFFSDSDKLTNDATAILDRVAATLNRYPNANIDVLAHTDSQGSASYNQQLSESRATSVVAYLVSRNVARARLNPSAFGESQPLDTNETKAGRLRNRRVELFARKPLR